MTSLCYRKFVTQLAVLEKLIGLKNAKIIIHRQSSVKKPTSKILQVIIPSIKLGHYCADSLANLGEAHHLTIVN